MSHPVLFVSAGDPSGDNATCRVISSLKQSVPDLAFFGLGGDRLKQQGQEQLADKSDLAVLGFWEVAKRYTYFRLLMLQCVEQIQTRKPSCLLLVDYPGFNLRLAQRVRKLGIPIIYYISPQIWAWGRRRLAQIREFVDLMIIILPFEREFYKESGVRTEFVGHYLLEDIPAQYIGSPLPNSRQLALLPGSRRQEVERMLDPMLRTAELYTQQCGGKAVIAAATDFDYDGALKPYSGRSIIASREDSRKIIYESDLVLTASGTATLETGIIARPMVIIYRTGFLTYQIARRLVTIDKIGLVNLVLGEKVVPELIQGEAVPDRLFAALRRFTDDAQYRDRTRDKLLTLPTVLGGTGASQRVAELVSRYL